MILERFLVERPVFEVLSFKLKIVEVVCWLLLICTVLTFQVGKDGPLVRLLVARHLVESQQSGGDGVLLGHNLEPATNLV